MLLSGKKIYLLVKKTLSSNAPQYSLMDHILDVCVVIDSLGRIQFFNKQASTIFGYSLHEMIGRNVKVLMPSPFNQHHDEYLQNYLNSNQPKIIGIGREVVAQKKDGSLIPIHLSVTEHRTSQGDPLFIGILRVLQNDEDRIIGKTVLDELREVLNSLLVPAIVIDQTGVIHGFNTAVQQLLGYKLIEVIGKNVRMLMSSPHHDLHNQYLENYLKTGKQKVIGIGREVKALHKDGHQINVRLSVAMREDGAKKLFTGVLQVL